MRTVLGFLRRRARRDGVVDGRSSAAVIIQRFGGALNLNVHLHALVGVGDGDRERALCERPKGPNPAYRHSDWFRRADGRRPINGIQRKRDVVAAGVYGCSMLPIVRGQAEIPDWGTSDMPIPSFMTRLPLAVTFLAVTSVPIWLWSTGAMVQRAGAQRVTATDTAPVRWTSIGPLGLPNGRVAAIAIDPADQDHWLLGAGNWWCLGNSQCRHVLRSPQ